jgi:hypothetical protein
MLWQAVYVSLAGLIVLDHCFLYMMHFLHLPFQFCSFQSIWEVSPIYCTFTTDGERNLSQTASLSIQLLLINWLQPLCGPSPVPPPAHRWRRPLSPFSPLITSVCFFVNNSTTTNFRLHDEEMVNGFRKIYRASIFCFNQQHVNINTYICTYANTHTSPPHTLCKRKQKRKTSVCLLQTETKLEVCFPWSANRKC